MSFSFDPVSVLDQAATDHRLGNTKPLKFKQYLDSRSNKNQNTLGKVAFVAITVICAISMGIAVATAVPLPLTGKIVFGSMGMLAILLNAFASFSAGKSYGAKEEISNIRGSVDQIFRK